MAADSLKPKAQVRIQSVERISEKYFLGPRLHAINSRSGGAKHGFPFAARMAGRDQESLRASCREVFGMTEFNFASALPAPEVCRATLPTLEVRCAFLNSMLAIVQAENPDPEIDLRIQMTSNPVHETQLWFARIWRNGRTGRDDQDLIDPRKPTQGRMEQRLKQLFGRAYASGVGSLSSSDFPRAEPTGHERILFQEEAEKWDPC
jgi:hypothetical protein